MRQRQIIPFPASPKLEPEFHKLLHRFDSFPASAVFTAMNRHAAEMQNKYQSLDPAERAALIQEHQDIVAVGTRRMGESAELYSLLVDLHKPFIRERA